MIRYLELAFKDQKMGGQGMVVGREEDEEGYKTNEKIRKMLLLLRLCGEFLEVHNKYLKITIMKKLLKGRHNFYCECASSV